MHTNQTMCKTLSSLGDTISYEKSRQPPSLCSRRNPTNANAQKLKAAQSELAEAYLNEQTKYIQHQINKVRDSVEYRQSWIAWQTVNEVSSWKSSARAKLKAASQEDRIHLWKDHFKDLLEKSPKVTDESITKIISNQLDIKLGPFTQELAIVLRKIKNMKVAGLDEIPPEVWKTRKFDDILLRYCNAIYNPNIIDGWTKGCILPFTKEGDLKIAKNY